jgi:H+/Cl- antiporter ClcA
MAFGNFRGRACATLNDRRGNRRNSSQACAHARRNAGTLGFAGVGAMLSGALGVPLTAILFSLELTRALPALLPLTLACTASYLVTSLVMPR